MREDDLPSESQERDAAWERGKSHSRSAASGSSGRHPFYGTGSESAMRRAFPALANSVRDYAIFLMDADGVITYWGEGARLIKWWTPEEAEGSHLRLLYPDGGAEDGTAGAHLDEAAHTGEYSGEGHRVRSDCSMFWAGVTLTALRDDDSELIGFVKVTRDLTAQRATEAVRQAALDSAEEASHFKSQFLATVSHEVRTPLTSVMAYTDLLKMESAGPLTERQHQYLNTMRSSSQHLLRLIDDILDLSRAEAGHVSVGHSTVSVGDVVREVLTFVKPQSLQLGVEIIDAVAGAAAQHHFVGDEERVRQILLNLVGNAIKFTEHGGRVIISAGSSATAVEAALDAESGPWVYFRVEDTGPGVPAGRQDAIFEPFMQVDMSATRRHGGTGLGLAISRRLARLMGGDVTLRSNEGLGSTFFLWLPSAPGIRVETFGSEEAMPPSSSGTLHALRGAVLGEMERILYAYVARMRSDTDTPSARQVPEAELEDHLASFIADVAQTLSALELTTGPRFDALYDGTIIQRTIAEQHGRQRARLGWGRPELERELEILRDELSAAVRRRVRLPRQDDVDEAIGVLLALLERAQTIALASYDEASTERDM